MLKEKYRGETEIPNRYFYKVAYSILQDINSLFHFTMEANKTYISYSFAAQIYFINVAFVVNTAMDKQFFSAHAGIALAQGIRCWPREPYPLLANPTSTKTEGVVVISNSQFRHKKTSY